MAAAMRPLATSLLYVNCLLFRLTISGEEESRLKLVAMHQSTSISEDDEPSVNTYLCAYRFCFSVSYLFPLLTRPAAYVLPLFLFSDSCQTCLSCSLAVLDLKVGHTTDVLSPFIRHVSFMRHLKNMRTVSTPNKRRRYAKTTELYILWSELNRRKLSPTLATAHYSCPDNAIGLVGRQSDGNFLIATNVYVDQTSCTILINWTVIQIETQRLLK